VAEITRKRNGEILRAAFAFLLEQPDAEARGTDVLAHVEQRIGLTPFEQGTYASGVRRFENIARFATLGTVKAGWLVKQKGRWTVTEEGRIAYQTFVDPEQFCRESDARYREWRRSQPAELDEPSIADASAEAGAIGVDAQATQTTQATQAAIRLEEAEESAWSEVEQFIQTMPPYDFQELVGALLRALGYFVVWIAPPGKDGGVDLVAAPDPLGTRLPRIKVQVKRQQQAVSVDGLRSFMATLGSDDVGLFVATGGFTRDAREEARLQATRRVTLIDLERLYDLWVEQYPKIPDEDRRRLPLRPVYFLAME
jgi:restriction system protein